MVILVEISSKAEDIELTSSEIAKNLVYNAICEAHFEKKEF